MPFTEAEIAEQLDANLENLFRPTDLQIFNDEHPLYAFSNLVGIYSDQFCPEFTSRLKFDAIALQQMLGRIQRDAYGVHLFGLKLNRMAAERRISNEIRNEIMSGLDGLGIRINSDSPRKTRIVAVFSLWMATLRPVYISGQDACGHPREVLETFSAGVNLWIATSYLLKFGDIDFGTAHETDVKMARIKHDFTYRSINLSSLEMLYCSLFRVPH